MTSDGNTLIAGTQYNWIVIPNTVAYSGLGGGAIDVLRIFSEDAGFDIAMRLSRHEYYDGSYIVVAGQIIVLGNQFPNSASPVQKGARIRIRQKISVLPDKLVNVHAVRRIIEWCLSLNFKAVRCDVFGMPQTGLQPDFSTGVPRLSSLTIP